MICINKKNPVCFMYWLTKKWIHALFSRFLLCVFAVYCVISPCCFGVVFFCPRSVCLCFIPRVCDLRVRVSLVFKLTNGKSHNKHEDHGSEHLKLWVISFISAVVLLFRTFMYINKIISEREEKIKLEELLVVIEFLKRSQLLDVDPRNCQKSTADSPVSGVNYSNLSRQL